MQTYKLPVTRYDFDVEDTYVLLRSDGSRLMHEVVSSNPRIKRHLEQILGEPITTIYPIALKPSVKNRALVLSPNQLQYFYFACDRLSWYGYRIGDRIQTYDEVAKSLFSVSSGVRELITKSMGGDMSQYIKPSRSHPGHRIVERVPPGFVAVHSSGKILGPNHWLNADIDKEGAEWTLQPQQTQEGDLGDAPGRRLHRNEVAFKKRSYHPAMHEGIYQPEAAVWEDEHGGVPGEEKLPRAKGYTPENEKVKDDLRAWFKQQPSLAQQVGDLQAAEPAERRRTTDDAKGKTLLAQAEELRQGLGGPPAEAVSGIKLPGQDEPKQYFGNNDALKVKMGYGAPGGKAQGEAKLDPSTLQFGDDVSFYSASQGQIVRGDHFTPKIHSAASDWRVIQHGPAAGRNEDEIAKQAATFESQHPGQPLPAELIPNLGKQRYILTGKMEGKYDFASLAPLNVKMPASPSQLSSGQKGVASQGKINQIEVKRLDSSAPEEKARIKAANVAAAARKRLSMTDRDVDGLRVGVTNEDAVRGRLLTPSGMDKLMGYDKVKGPNKERFYRSFEDRPYQALGVELLSDAGSYGRFKGPQESDGVFLNWIYGLGKALMYSENVITPYGRRRIGDLKVGDLITGSQGTPIRVLGTYPQGVRPIYRLTFHDGTTAEADSEHLWTTQTLKERQLESNRRKKAAKREQRGDWKRGAYTWTKELHPTSGVRTTREILETLRAVTAQGEKLNHSIQYVKPVEYAVAGDRRVPAYLLGAYLGDGTCYGKYITNTDQEMFDVLTQLDPGFRMVQPPNGGTLLSGAPSLEIKQAIDQLGLRMLRAWEKFIPESYLYAPVAERVALLQGLLDTDGYALGQAQARGNRQRTAGIEFVTVSPQLRDGVAELVRGLGGAVTWSARVGRYRTDQGVTETRETYRMYVRFSEDAPFVPFRLSRKAAAYRGHAAENFVKYIEKVEYVRDEEAVCIKVDAPDELFVLEQYVVTHNTTVVCAADAAVRNKHGVTGMHVVVCPNVLTETWRQEVRESRNAEAIVVDGTVEQRQKIWSDIADMVERGKPPKFVVVAAGKFRQTEGGLEEDTSDDPAEQIRLREQGNKESSMDIQALKVLSVGGKFPWRDKEITPKMVTQADGTTKPMGHVAFTTVDETSLFMNPKSGRHKVMQDLIEHTTAGGSIVWSLNGDIAGNSAADFVTNLSLVNRHVRQNYAAVVEEYTTPYNNDQPQGRRVFLPDSMEKMSKRFEYQVSSMTGISATGHYGLKHAPHHYSQMGEEFSAVYNEIYRRMNQLAHADESEAVSRLKKYTMAHLTIMRQATENVADARTLTEYGLESLGPSGGFLMQDIQHHFNRINPAKSGETPQERKAREEKIRTSVEDVIGRLRQYQAAVTDEPLRGFRCPNQDLALTDRKKKWEQIMGPDHAAMLDRAIALRWHNPSMDHLMGEVRKRVKSQQQGGPRLRLGFASMSRRYVEMFAARMRTDPKMMRGGAPMIDINAITGDTTADEVKAITDHHQAMNAHEVQQARLKHAEREKYARLSDRDFCQRVLKRNFVDGDKDRPVISMVTSAGTFGISLPAAEGWRQATWNSARGRQLEARYHRSPSQECTITKMVAPGLGRYVNQLEEAKGATADILSALFSGNLDDTVANIGRMETPPDQTQILSLMNRLDALHHTVEENTVRNPRRYA